MRDEPVGIPRNLRIFLIVLIALPAVFSVAIAHTYISYSNRDLYLPPEADPNAAAEERILSYGVGLYIGVVIFTFLCFSNSRSHPQAFDDLRLFPKLYWPYFIVVTFVSLPWIFAMFGIYISDYIPIFAGRQLYHGFPMVHLGVHHGLDGYLIVVLLPLVFKTVRRFKLKHLKIFTFGMVAGFIWGVYLLLEDGINEQLFKRHLLPSKLLPSPTSGNPYFVHIIVVILVTSLIFWVFLLKRE